MMLMLIFLPALYVNAQKNGLGENVQSNGIVLNAMEDGEPWPTKQGVKYTFYLECDYRQSNDIQIAPFFIRCIKYEGDSHLTLSIRHNKSGFDEYKVTSCDLKQVINSVFPPKWTDGLLGPDRIRLSGQSSTSVTYKTTSGKCFSRTYKWIVNLGVPAERRKQMETKCPGNDEKSKMEAVAEFTNCVVPKELTPIVKGHWDHGKQGIWPSFNTGLEPEPKPLLECGFGELINVPNEPNSHMLINTVKPKYVIKCFQADVKDKYFSFVSKMNRNVDRFDVKSCTEEDIVNGIFPLNEDFSKGTTDPSTTTIWFAHANKKCYKREYPNFLANQPTMPSTQIDCPRSSEEWIHPSTGFAGMWRGCTGPMSTKEIEEKEKEKKTQKGSPSGGNMQKKKA